MASLRCHTIYALCLTLLIHLSSALAQDCNNTYTLTSSDTCVSIMENHFQKTWKLFPLYNNGETCSSLTLYEGLEICVPPPPPPPPPPPSGFNDPFTSSIIYNNDGSDAPTPLSCAAYYKVQLGDSYYSVLYNYFESNETLFHLYNGVSSTVSVGQWICLATSPNALYATLAPTELIPGTNLGFPVGLNASQPATNSTATNKRNQFARYVSLGFVNRTTNATWDYPLVKDWRAQGKLQPITNQGNCSSCWAHAATAAIDSAYAIVYNIGIRLSMQQVIECTNIGCNGAWPTDALNYAASASVVPYTYYPLSANPGACHLNSEPGLSTLGYPNLVSAYETVNFQGWLGLLLALQQQPVIVNLYGSYPSFQNYVGGVYADASCSDSVIDHTVLFVGYNLEDSTPYWILRNSWGSSWGEDGYMRMKVTGGKGICGIHSLPGVYPVVPNPNPCGGINPCGGGQCNSNSDSNNYTCTCPTEFISVQNTDGTQTCTPTRVCSYLASNPCGFGTCVDDMLGAYSCICPAGSSSGQRADGSTTCVPSVLTTQTTLYAIQPNDTCYLIANAFSTSIANLNQQNPSLNCSSLVTGMAIHIPSTQGCSVAYSVNSNDTCDSMQSLFSLTLADFTSLNPSLNCSVLIPGQQVCAAPGPFEGIPICTRYEVSYPGDTCTSIMAGANLTPLEFFGMNPGLYCDRLSIDNSTLTPGADVCISANPPESCSCSTGNFYYVISGDTCTRIISNYFPGGMNQFKSLNCNMACATPRLYVGQQLCRP